MMNTGQQRWYQKEHFAYMKWITQQCMSIPMPLWNNNTVSYMDSLDLSDISIYEDYMMTTSDDKGITRIGRGTVLTFELWFA